MKKEFTQYRSQILVTGLNNNEASVIDSILGRYVVFFKDTLRNIERLDNYDLICLTLIDYLKNKNTVNDSQKKFLIIGDIGVPGCSGFIQLKDSAYHWLEMINSIVPPVRTPQIIGLEQGSIVRSKTTPQFGKGVVTQVLSENEVMVKFPNTALIDKNRALRCHKSQLQVLGKLDNLKNI